MIEIYFLGVGLTALWMFADDFDRFTALAAALKIEPKYRLRDYLTRPFYFPYLLFKFITTTIKH